MTGLRKSIILMLIYLSIVFNIERLDYAGQNVVNIQSFVYVVIITAILATLVSRFLQRYSIYFGVLLWTGVYLILKFLVFTNRPVYGDIYTYLTITELALISISVLLAYDLARSLVDFEEVIEKVTFPKHGQRIVGMKESNEDVKTEFIRSRRHNRPLSVLVIEMDPKTNKVNLERVVKNIQKSMLDRYLLASLAQILSKEARRTDLIIEQDEKDRFVLLCPETTGEGSSVLAERVQSQAMAQLGITVNCGAAAFPDEALTFEDLLKKATFNLLSPQKQANFSYSEYQDVNVDRKESH